MESFLLYWLLFAGVVLGFLLGRYSRKARTSQNTAVNDVSIEYIRGLNHLLNEDADAAVDTFTDLLPVNSKTLDTHLALGGLLRRRGEVGRAIRLHQNLVKHEGLSKQDGQKALLELGLDYLKAGVLDRAEDIFEQLQSAEDDDVCFKSLSYLAEIYRDEKEWQKAANVVDSMLRKKLPANASKWRAMQAHFYCEQAQQVLAAGEVKTARRFLSKAYMADDSCVRVSLQLADLELAQGQFRQAIRYLKRVPEQDPDYIPEILPGLLESYRALGAVDELIDYLKQLQDRYPSTSVLISLADQVQQHESEGAAVALLDQKLQSRPSLRVVGKFLDVYWRRKTKDAPDKEQTLIRSLLELLLTHKSYYRCGSCGFSGNQLHWQCPSCKNWGSIKAIKGLEGE